MAETPRAVPGDRCSRALSALRDLDPARLAALRARAVGFLAAVDAGEVVWGGDGAW